MFLRNFDNHLIVCTWFPFEPTNNVNSIAVNNYKNYVFSIGSTTIFEDGNVNRRLTNGTIEGIPCCYLSGYYYLFTYMSCDRNHICLGTGTTEVTYDDYKLSGDVIDNTKLTYVSHEFIYDSETHKYKKRILYTYTNTGTEDITIAEWGIYQCVNSDTSNVSLFSNSGEFVLFFREVLAEPITISAGTTATITLEVDFPMMHHA